MWKVIVFFSAFVCICPKTVMAVLTVVPRNTVAKTGDSAHLNCSTDVNNTSVYWKHGDRFVYTGGPVFEPYNIRFKIEMDSKAAYNLVIQSVELTDAGKYVCQDDGGYGGQGSAELIVIEKHPICHPNMTLVEVIGPNSCDLEPERVLFSCSLSYNGNVPPELVWKRSGENVAITEGVNRTVSGKTATYTLAFKANDLSNDNRSFICETKEATNLQYKCSTPVMKILYVFSNQTIDEKSVDEKIVCSANSSQSCSYNWKGFRDQKEVIVSNNKVLNPVRNGSYRCEAECQMRNESCVVVSMIIEIVPDSVSTSPENVSESSSPPWWMVLLIIIGVVLLIVLVLCIIIIKRRNLLNRNRKTLSADEKELTGATESLPLTSHEADIKEVKETETSNGNEEKKANAEKLSVNSIKEDTQLLKDKSANETALAKSDAIGETSAEPVTWNLSHGQEVRGLTIGDDRIYVLTYNPIYVEVYDIEGHSNTGSRSLSGIVMFPCDMAYCKLYKRLYIMDGTKRGETKKIFLLDELLLNPIGSWESYFDYGNLSVAFDCNVILAARNAIVEYSPEGKVIRRITVHETVIPLCIIKIDAYDFLVSRGQRNGDMYEVCLVKTAKNASTDKTYQVEKIEKSYGNKAGPESERVNNPRSLAVSENKDVFVLDEKNNRVLKLNSDLVLKEEILLSKHGLQSPVKVCLSESRGQLVVVGNSVDAKNSDARIPGILVLPLSLKDSNQ